MKHQLKDFRFLLQTKDFELEKIMVRSRLWKQLALVWRCEDRLGGVGCGVWKEAALIIHGSGGQAGGREHRCMGHPSLDGFEPGLMDAPRTRISVPIPLLLAASGCSRLSPGTLRSIWRRRLQQKKSPRYHERGLRRGKAKPPAKYQKLPVLRRGSLLWTPRSWDKELFLEKESPEIQGRRAGEAESRCGIKVVHSGRGRGDPHHKEEAVVFLCFLPQVLTEPEVLRSPANRGIWTTPGH